MGNWESNMEAEAETPEISPFFRIISRDWRLVAIIAVVITLAVAASSFLLPTTYRATITLFPRPQMGDMTRLSASSLLGLGSGSSASTDEALSTLSSDRFVGEFLTRYNYLPLLYPDLWDAQAHAWKKGRPPDIREAVHDFNENLKAETKITSPIVTVTYVNEDPRLAAEILNRLINDLNASMQNAALSRSRAIIAEYNQELQSPAARTADVQQHLGQLITDEMKTLVTARASPDYIFRVLDPAITPDRKAAPQRAVIVIVGGVLSLLAGLLTVFLRQFFRDVRAGLRREGR